MDEWLYECFFLITKKRERFNYPKHLKTFKDITNLYEKDLKLTEDELSTGYFKINSTATTTHNEMRNDHPEDNSFYNELGWRDT